MARPLATDERSHSEWRHPHDPDARITKMKDGRTHLAHKAEHAVDLETGAIVGVTVQGARISAQCAAFYASHGW